MASNKVIGVTAGVFDLFHVGHLNILKRAKKNCDFLVVAVTSDELAKYKNVVPASPQKDRMEIIRSIRYVDKVIKQDSMDKVKLAQESKANVMFVGSDWKGTETWLKHEEDLSKIGCKVVYFDYTKKVSSTKLREILKNER